MQCTDQNIVRDWIYTRSNDLKKVEEYEEEGIIIKGYVQSGKTAFMLYNATLNLLNGVSSVIVLRNTTGDHTQITSRLRGLQDEIKEETGVDMELYNETTTGPRIFVEIGNNSRLSKLNEKLIDQSFVLFIDEADSNDTGDNKRTTEMGIMKEAANKVFFISATILDLSMKESTPEVIDLTADDFHPLFEEEAEEDIPVYKVHMLTPPENYMGIEKLMHRSLPAPALPCNKNEDDPMVRDENLRPFLEKFATFEPHYMELFDNHHPQHCLISCGSAISPQKSLFNHIATSGLDIAVIMYNGDGIDVFHPSLVKDTIVMVTDGGRKVVGGRTCPWAKGAHSFGKNVGIADILGWLKRNGGVELFPRIITISGKLAGRGISFVSDDYGKYMRSFGKNGCPTTVGWRLTSMYYVPSTKTSQPNLMQAVGRVCCVCRDNIPTYLYTTDDVFEDVRKSYWTQEELVARTNKHDIRMGEVTMNTSKLSKRKLTSTGVKRIAKEHTVPWFEDDGGFDPLTTYHAAQPSTDSEWDLGPRPDSNPKIVRPTEMDVSEFDRLVNKMFPLWAKQDATMISGFMHQIDPDKVYTQAEIKESCTHYSIRLTDVMNHTGPSHTYGSIFKKVNEDQYVMYPELIESYKLNF